MIWDPLHEYGMQAVERLLLEHIVAIDNLLEVSQLLAACQDGRELFVVNTAIVEYHSVDSNVLEKLAGSRKSVCVTNAQCVALKT